jgi:DNA-binding GntR family transcriptional regulator
MANAGGRMDQSVKTRAKKIVRAKSHAFSLKTPRVNAKPSTKGDKAEAAIRGFLASGEFSPGEKISLRKLASALGVSVMPVRNAVARLQADGALEVEPGRAVRVPVMTSAQFRELLQVRMEIEGYAAEMAAINRSEAELRCMEELNASFQILGVGEATRSSGAARVNMEFHFAVYRAARMPMLIDIIERLWLKAGPVVFYHIYLERFSSPSRDSVRLHKDALAALRRKDGAAARMAIAEDLWLAGERLLAEGIFKERP